MKKKNAYFVFTSNDSSGILTSFLLAFITCNIPTFQIQFLLGMTNSIVYNPSVCSELINFLAETT